MVNENKIEVLNDTYNNMINIIYLHYNIVDVRKVHKYEEELLRLNIYLPCLLRDFLEEDYLLSVNGSPNQDNILKELYHTRLFSQQEKVKEFVEWIKVHSEYESLFNKDNYDELQRELSDLKKDYDAIKNIKV